MREGTREKCETGKEETYNALSLTLSQAIPKF